jgi:hypothetical protein
VANRTISAADKAHWLSMARAWTDLALRTEAVDRFIQAHFDSA